MAVIKVGDVATGLAQWLANNNFGVFDEHNPYLATDQAITLRLLPTKPDTALAVTPYGVDDPHGYLTNTTVMVQLRFRGVADDLTSADAWADQVAAKLHDAQLVQLPNDLLIQRAVRTIVAPLGPDENHRPERADSYRLLFMLPTSR